MPLLHQTAFVLWPWFCLHPMPAPAACGSRLILLWTQPACLRAWALEAVSLLVAVSVQHRKSTEWCRLPQVHGAASRQAQLRSVWTATCPVCPLGFRCNCHLSTHIVTTFCKWAAAAGRGRDLSWVIYWVQCGERWLSLIQDLGQYTG